MDEGWQGNLRFPLVRHARVVKVLSAMERWVLMSFPSHKH